MKPNTIKKAPAKGKRVPPKKKNKEAKKLNIAIGSFSAAFVASVVIIVALKSDFLITWEKLFSIVNIIGGIAVVVMIPVFLKQSKLEESKRGLMYSSTPMYLFSHFVVIGDGYNGG